MAVESTINSHTYEDANNDNNQNVQCDCKDVIETWKVLGKRWSLLILKSLDSKESIRFNGLKRTLSGISSTVLADRLLELEREGLIVKKIYPEMPPRVEYSLTYRAKELGIILRSLGDWVKKWNSKLKTTGIYQIETNINTNINRQVSR
jgi:DNA-binding HxlR family transcriptional regulator